MKTYVVYMHVFPNGKRYIGITSQVPVSKRWGASGYGYRKCPKMRNAIEKYGWKNVEHIILYNELTKEEAENLEIALIKKYNTIKNGYNVENGGNVIGTHSEETKRKIGLANKGKIVSESTREKLRNREPLRGELNPFYGHHHSEAVKKQQSVFMTGNQYNKGNHHTEEFKKMKSQQMSALYSNGGNPRCKRVVMISEDGNEEYFHSLRNAASVKGISPSSLCKYIKNEMVVNGCKWRYV